MIYSLYNLIGKTVSLRTFLYRHLGGIRMRKYQIRHISKKKYREHNLFEKGVITPMTSYGDTASTQMRFFSFLQGHQNALHCNQNTPNQILRRSNLRVLYAVDALGLAEPLRNFCIPKLHRNPPGGMLAFRRYIWDTLHFSPWAVSFPKQLYAPSGHQSHRYNLHPVFP